jgi:hypothetical protein
VGPKASLDVMMKRKSPCHCLELNPDQASSLAPILTELFLLPQKPLRDAKLQSKHLENTSQIGIHVSTLVQKRVF